MMKSRNLRNALVGTALALVAAYILPVLLLKVLGFVGPLIIIPLYSYLYTCWLVIPLGAALGMFIPQMAKGKTRWMAALHGAGFGALAGLVSAFCLTSVFNLYRERGLGILWISGILYCALFVAGYAFYCAKSQRLYR